MALPRRGSRRLSVDGADYRWRASRTVRRNPDTDHLYVEHHLRAEPLSHPGALLSVRLDSRLLFTESYRVKYLDFLSITPAVVAAAIRQARAGGWAYDAHQRRPRRFELEGAGPGLREALARAAEQAGPPGRDWHDWHKG